MRFAGRRWACLALVLTGLALIAVPAAAQDTLFPPVVDKGFVDVQWRGFSDLSNEQDHFVEVEVAPFDRASFSVEVALEGEEPDGIDTKTVALESRVQFLPEGKYFFDVGSLLTYQISADAGAPDIFEANLLVQRNWKKLQALTNITVQRDIFGDEERFTRFLYGIEGRYKVNEYMQFGAQAFGAPGPFTDKDPLGEQFHTVGPAFFGIADFGGSGRLIYNAAVLFGATAESPDQLFRWELIYQFRF